MDLSFWRDVAVVVLAVETFIAMLIPMVAFFFGIKGLRWLEKNTKVYGKQARHRWQRVHRQVAGVTRVVESPFREVDSIWQAVRNIGKL